MTALDTGEVLDVALRTLQPDDAPDDGNLPESPWTVTDEDTAAWALAKIRQARTVARRRNQPALDLIAEYQAAIDELQQVVDSNDQAAQDTVDWFTGHLTAWHRRQWEVDDDPKHRRTNTIKLPGGELQSRAGREKWDVTDPDALLAAAVEAGADFCTTVPKPDKNRLAAWFKENGEVPAGAERIPAERKWQVVL